jgi:peptide deformylase
MAAKEILLLGDPRLYDVCAPVEKEELYDASLIAQDLHDTLIEFRNVYGKGRAIAAPQIGIFKRIVYMHIDEPVILINPVLSRKSRDMIVVRDDCMSFPELTVLVRRHRRCRISYRDLDWCEQSHPLEDDLSELLQHECDHLDGVLAVSRAIDGRSFALEKPRR